MALAPEIAALARAQQPDRYLSALAAPAVVHDDLIALAAFAAELKRIPRLVHDPLVGEIRLTWWRDALERLAEGEPAGHPLAEAIALPLRQGFFPVARLTAFIDALAFDLSPLPFADEQAREVYLVKTEGALFRLALARLGAEEGQESLIRAAAFAYGLARAALSLTGPAPLVTEEDLAASRLTIHQLATDTAREARMDIANRLAGSARAALDQARGIMLSLSVSARPALFPLVMTEPYLRWAVRKSGPPASAPLTRVWRIWRAARTRGRPARRLRG